MKANVTVIDTGTHIHTHAAWIEYMDRDATLGVAITISKM